MWESCRRLRGVVPEHHVPPLSGEVMSVQALSWVFDHSESRLAARHVLLSIANHANSSGRDSWPSIPRIAKEAKISCREVYRCLQELVTIGELRIQNSAGPHGCNLYTMPGVTKSQGGGVTFSQDTPDQKSPEPSLTVQKRNRHARSAQGNVFEDEHGFYVVTPERFRKYVDWK
jgi:hypothetical protein